MADTLEKNDELQLIGAFVRFERKRNATSKAFQSPFD
jgi:hypothetical protein